jgi:hypothetical protein
MARLVIPRVFWIRGGGVKKSLNLCAELPLRGDFKWVNNIMYYACLIVFIKFLCSDYESTLCLSPFHA